MKQLSFHEIRPDIKERIAQIQSNRTPIALLCDRMEYLPNVGSIFRLGDAARLQHIYFYQNQLQLDFKKIDKVARSTQKYVPFTLIESPQQLIDLKNQFEWVALEKTDQSIPYTQFQPQTDKPILLVLGSEVQGVSPFLLENCGQSLEIPMLGVNTSMNVANAAGIVVYGLINNLKM